MPISPLANRLGLTPDGPDPIIPGDARLDNLVVTQSLTINTTPLPAVGSVLAATDNAGTTGWVDVNTVSSTIVYRLNIDPQSHVDPIINGLQVDAVDTQPGPFPLPLTNLDQGLDLANPIVMDPYNSFALNVTPGVGITSITCQRAGLYQFSMHMPVLDAGAGTSTGIIQLLRAGQNIFTAPPIINCIASIDSPLAGFGGGGLPFSYAANFTAVSPTWLNVGDELSLIFALDTGSVIIPLTSNLSIVGLN